MLTMFKHFFKVLAPNPIPSTLHVLPYMESVLDAELYDKLRYSILDVTKYAYISDGYILDLLQYLSDSNLVELTSITPVSATGTVYFIKRL